MSQPINHHPASFRDPSGFIYERDGTIYRFISTNYQQDYELLQQSGLAEELLKKKLLLPFVELSENHTGRIDWYNTLQPQQLPFISYAWEWCFEQLKDAALTTLTICRLALQKGMILKDATPANIQLVEGKFKLIDTLSFETYKEGESWVAYRQFCECFLNPLLIAVHTAMEVHRLQLSYPDGIPAAATSKLLPFKTKLNATVYLHVHLQAKMTGKQSVDQKQTTRKITQKNIDQILQNLHSCISGLKLPEQATTWNNYYAETILSETYFSGKKKLVASLLERIQYRSVLDLGANEGEFSLLCNKDAVVISTDFDSDCINRLCRRIKEEKRTNIYPAIIDLTYPSPSLGWMNQERSAFFSRTKVDVCMALALIHHLAIAKNITLEQLASFFASICKVLLIEFVPKNDPKVVGMLQWRKDIFDNYNEEAFEQSFAQVFELERKMKVPGSERTMYVYQNKQLY